MKPFKVDSLVSINFSILSMLSKKVFFRQTMAAKQTNIILVAKIEHVQFTYSIKPLATWKMYTNCEANKHPNSRKPWKTRFSAGYFWFDWFVELMPRISYCLWIVWKILILFLIFFFISIFFSMLNQFLERNTSNTSIYSFSMLKQRCKTNTKSEFSLNIKYFFWKTIDVHRTYKSFIQIVKSIIDSFVQMNQLT